MRFPFISLLFLIYSRLTKVYLNHWSSFWGPPLTTQITRREIRKGIEVKAKHSCEAIKRASEAVHSLQDVEVEAVKTLAKKVTSAHFSQSWQEKVDAFFNNCHAHTIAIPGTAVDKVLDLYFDGEPPFGGSDKKAEFPDAFVLQALGTVGTPNTEIIYIISDDNDFAKACMANSNWKHFKSLDYLLSLAQQHSAIIEKIHATIKVNNEHIQEKLKDVLNSLPAELQGWPGSVQLNSIWLDDVLDILIIACEDNTASVTFVCSVDIEAMIELHTSPGELAAYKEVKENEHIYITLVFDFDPKNAKIFELTEIWSPPTLIIRAGA